MVNKGVFDTNTRRDRRFEKIERAGWEHERSKLKTEAPTAWGTKRGRIDIRINEDDGSVSIIELKATNWDHIKPSRIRVTALRHACQVWRYINDFVENQKCQVCPGIIYEMEPTDPEVRRVVESALHERCLQVVWRNSGCG